MVEQPNVKSLKYNWKSGDTVHEIEFAYVQGTGDHPFLFGEAAMKPIDVQDFHIVTVPVTQAFWTHVMGEGSNPSVCPGDHRPVENVSWDGISQPDGFLSRINAGSVLAELAGQVPGSAQTILRLPTETEWEYAARGGPNWTDGLMFSGSNDIGAVAWYKDNSGDRTHDVAQKAPNQLGVYDMSGNLWEWCLDSFPRETRWVPAV